VPQALVTEYDMMTLPPDTPVTMPVPPTVAIVVLLLLQTPPGATSVNVMFVPSHTVDAPIMVPATGTISTVIGEVVVAVPQELVTEYEMVVLPTNIPDTTPAPLIVAIDVLLLLQTPPGAPSVNVVVEPTHTLVAPTIVPATGKGLTVIGSVATAVPQALVTEYEMVVLPADTPVTIPVLLTVAIAVLLLLQTPPGAPSVNVIVEATHTLVAPVIVPGTGNTLTEKDKVAAAVPQELVTEYEMMTLPADTPDTTPVPLIVATDMLLLLHTPPGVPSVNVVVAPTHTPDAPAIVPATGIGLTVIGCVATAAPQELVTE
jgi:hypothetical protein